MKAMSVPAPCSGRANYGEAVASKEGEAVAIVSRGLKGEGGLIKGGGIRLL